MRKILFLMLAFLVLNAQNITNGDIEIYAVSPNMAKNLSIDGKVAKWLYSAKSNKKFAIVVASYHKKGRIVLKNGSKSVIYNVVQGKYKKEQITVAKAKATPPSSAKARIKAESAEANEIYATANIGLKFSSKFIKPLNSKITSEFGPARVFNEVVKSFHGGVDFRAAVGTPVIAANDGVVAIAKERYYAGGSVVIDHGEGIYTQYYHLDSISVRTGQSVKRGEQIGLSGASGRVSGAHLHFGVIVGNQQVDPLKFIDKINKFLN